MGRGSFRRPLPSVTMTVLDPEVIAKLLRRRAAEEPHSASIFVKLSLEPSDDNRRVLAVLAYLNS